MSLSYPSLTGDRIVMVYDDTTTIVKFVSAYNTDLQTSYDADIILHEMGGGPRVDLSSPRTGGVLFSFSPRTFKRMQEDLDFRIRTGRR